MNIVAVKHKQKVQFCVFFLEIYQFYHMSISMYVFNSDFQACLNLVKLSIRPLLLENMVSIVMLLLFKKFGTALSN